jgi:predicted cupin superfamily sugar epimerase
MHSRARALIDELRLVPHPEGGFFREVYRSASRVGPDDGRPQRSAITMIDFLLVDGGCSRWHQVRSDEIWHFYEGDPLDLFVAPSALDTVNTACLSERGSPERMHVAPANWWQAARTRGAYSLVGCTVAPGFEYSDFTFLRDVPDAMTLLRRLDPMWLELT